MKYPNRIREIREAKGLTLEQLAAVANCSNQQISKLEKGQRSLDLEWMVRVARALGVQPWELLPPDMLPNDVQEFVRDFIRLPDDRKATVRQLARQLRPEDN